MMLLALCGPLAQAVELGALLTVGGDLSTGLRTGLDGRGGHAGLAFEVGGPRNALHIEPRAYVAWVRGTPGALPGVALGWTHRYGEADLHPYTLVGLGGYRSEVLPVLPVVSLSGGVEWRQEHVFVRGGLHGFTLPPFFVGGGVEASVGFTF